MLRRWLRFWGLAGLMTSAACTAGTATAPAVATAPMASTPVAPSAAPPPPAPGWPYWQRVDVTVHADGPEVPKLPLDVAQFSRTGSAESRWVAAPEAVQSAVLENGFAVWPRQTRKARFGAFYAELAGDRTPLFVTVDSLAFLVHIARNRALADVEATVLAPALDTVLQRLSLRLAAEQTGAPVDLAAGYRIARGVVAVAAALKGSAAVPADLAAVVQAEVALAMGHGGVAKSPLLGIPIDYSVFAVRGALGEADAQAGTFRAATWLAYAPLEVVAGTEQAFSSADVGTARNEMRAALLLTRLLQPDVDAEASRAWTQMARIAELVVGHPADISAAGLAHIVRGAGLDVHDAKAIADVVRLDHARHAVGHARPGASFRLVADRGAVDAAVLQALVAPQVPKRAMPTALDVGAWLGSGTARAALSAAGADTFSGYAQALAQQTAARPAVLEKHSSFYLTALDELTTYLSPSAADPTFAASASDAWARHKLEVSVATWAALRHDSLPFSRSVGPSATGSSAAGAPASSADPLRVFVEPHPEAIARLLGLVRHIARGLDAMSALAPNAPSRPLLVEVDAILSGALAASLAAAEGKPASLEVAAVLAAFPNRFAAVEARVAGSGDEETALVVDVHTNQDAGRVLEEGTGELDDLLAVVRDPATGKLVLAIGPTLPHYELERPSDKRLSDVAFRAALAAGGLTRDAFAAPAATK